MNSTVCSFCQTSAPRYFSAQDWNRRVSNELFTYYRCPACHLVFLSPRPVDLGKYYPTDYYSYPSTVEDLAKAAALERYKIEVVQQHAKAGRLLEVGSSYGAFAYLAKQAGFEVESIEMDARCCEFMRSTLGIRVYNELDPAKALETAGSYDVIALWQVIEHLPDPWSDLRAMAEHLNPGGILILAAPNPDAFQFHVQGRRWPHVDAPRHLALIPISVLRTHLERSGLQMVAASTRDPGSIQWNQFGWRVWLGNLAPRGRGKRVLYKVGDLLTALASPYETRDLRGSTYTVAFRKT